MLSNYGSISKIQRKNHYLQIQNSEIGRKNHYLHFELGRKNHYLQVQNLKLEGKTTTSKLKIQTVESSTIFSPVFLLIRFLIFLRNVYYCVYSIVYPPRLFQAPRLVISQFLHPLHVYSRLHVY